MRSVKEIKEDIEETKIAISQASNAEEKKDFEPVLEDLEKELKEAEAKAEAPKPAKAHKEHKAHKPAKAHKEEDEEVKFERAQQKRELEEAQAKHKKEAIIIVAGKEYDINDCKEAILALKARKVQSTKSAKKYKTKKPAAHAAVKIEGVVTDIEKSITDKAEGNPKLVISVLKQFRSKMNEAFSTLSKIISAQDIATMKKALKEIDDIIEKYK
jgi:D-alanyl-D-alanine dipeptidase